MSKTYTIALAGNPNVGKSTIFNNLTGMHQHTGNWTGKTVASALGYFKTQNNNYRLIDLPGTYSLMPHSPEEAVARDYVINEKPDAVIVVCDATTLCRNLTLVLQTIKVSKRVLVCVNLLDEADKKGIKINFKKLEERLHTRVIGITARNKKSVKGLTLALDELLNLPPKTDMTILSASSFPAMLSIFLRIISLRWMKTASIFLIKKRITKLKWQKKGCVSRCISQPMCR